MSGTNATDTTASGAPLSSLPTAESVQETDGVFGLFSGQAKFANPKNLVNAGMPSDVVRTDDLNTALSDTSLGKYTQQAGQSAESSQADADRSETAAGASSASAAQAAQTGAHVVIIAQGIQQTAGQIQDVADSTQQALSGVTSDANAAKVLLTAALNGNAPLEYKGYWNASTNTPALASSTGEDGDLYIVSVAGTTNLDGNAEWGVGDGAWFSGGKWLYFARAGWAAVAQEITALRAVGIGAHKLSSGGNYEFSICDESGNIGLSVSDAGVTSVINLGLPDGSFMASDETQNAPLRLVAPDGSYFDIGDDVPDPVIANAAPDLWLDARIGLTRNAAGILQAWDSKTVSPWQAKFAAGSPVVITNAIGDYPAVHFDGASALAHSLPFTPGTVIAVYRNTISTGSTQPAIAACDSTTAGTPAWALRGYIPMGVGGGYARAQGYQVGTSASATDFAGRVCGALGHWQVLGGIYADDTVSVASGTTRSKPAVRAISALPLSCGGKSGSIGAAYNGSGALTDFFYGDLCELLIWERPLSQREYNATVRSLQDKYGLQPAFGRMLYGAFQTTETGGEAGGVESLVMLSSDDGIEFQHVPTELIFDSQHTMRDPSITYHNGRFLLACTAGSFGSGYQDRFSVYQSTDGRHWSFVTDVICALNGAASQQTWAPEWFHSPADGVLRLVIHCIFPGTGSLVYEMHPEGDLLGAWSAPLLIPLAGHSSVVDSFPFYYRDRWVLFFKDEVEIQIATAPEPTGPYTVLTSGDWAKWGPGIEGPSILPLGEDAAGNTMIRAYIDAEGNGISYSDAVGPWPDVLTGTWSARKPLIVSATPQHGTCIFNPIPNFGV